MRCETFSRVRRERPRGATDNRVYTTWALEIEA